MHFTLKEDIFTKEGGTLFPVTFYFKDFFPQDFLEPKCRTSIPKTFFNIICLVVTVYNSTVYTAQYTLVQRTQYSIHSTVYTVQYTQYSIH